MTFLETCEVTALGSREKGGNEQACSCVSDFQGKDVLEREICLK